MQRARRRLGLGHVHGRAGEAQGLSRSVANGLTARQHPAPGSVLVAQPMLALETLRPPVQVRANGALHRFPVPRVHPVEPFRRGPAGSLRADQRPPRFRQPEAIGGQVPVPDPVARAPPGERVPIAHRVALLHHRRVSHLAAFPIVKRHDGPLAHPRLAGPRRRLAQQLAGVSVGQGLAQLGARLGPIGAAVREYQHGQLPFDRLRLRDPEQPLGRGVPGSHLPIGVAEQCRERGLLEQSRDRARPGRDPPAPFGFRPALEQIGDQRERPLEGSPIAVGPAVFLFDLAEELAQGRGSFTFLTEGLVELAAEASMHPQPGSRAFSSGAARWKRARL